LPPGYSEPQVLVSLGALVTAHGDLWGRRKGQGALPYDKEQPRLPCQDVRLDFFRSMVIACREGRLSRCDASRFVTSFLESRANLVCSRPKRNTG
jgi:hypothetical protein